MCRPVYVSLLTEGLHSCLVSSFDKSSATSVEHNEAPAQGMEDSLR